MKACGSPWLFLSPHSDNCSSQMERSGVRQRIRKLSPLILHSLDRRLELGQRPHPLGKRRRLGDVDAVLFQGRHLPLDGVPGEQGDIRPGHATLSQGRGDGMAERVEAGALLDPERIGIGTEFFGELRAVGALDPRSFGRFTVGSPVSVSVSVSP